MNTRAPHIPPLLGFIRPQWGGGGLLWEECRALSQDIYWSGNGEIERFSQIRKFECWGYWVGSVKCALLVSKSYFNKCLILKMSVLCVDIFYEISAKLRHLVWCQLLLVYVVWVARAPCPVSAHQLQERENIKLVCAQWPVTRCAKLRLITINNNQLNVTISITVIINSWWDCFWLRKQVILSLTIPRVSSAPSGYYQCQCWFPFLIFIATIEELKLSIVWNVNTSMLQHC